MGVVGAVAVSAIGINWSVHHPILAGAAVYVSWKGYKFVSKISNIVLAVPKYFLKKVFPGNRSALSTEDEEEVEDGIQAILDWATYDESIGDKVDVDIEIEDADKRVTSLESCVKIAKTFRDTLKGPIAMMCEEINNIKDTYPTVEEVNDGLKEYAQLTHFKENYLTKGQIEETYCNFDELTEFFSNKKDIDAKEKTLNDKNTANTSQLTTLTAKVNDCPTNKSFTEAINELSNGMNHYYLITDADAKFATKEEFTSMGTNIDKKFNDCSTKSQLNDYLKLEDFDVHDEQYYNAVMSLRSDKADKSALERLQKDVQTIASAVDTLGTTYATKEEFTAMGTNFDEKLGGYLKNNARWLEVFICVSLLSMKIIRRANP